jgi:carotenoid cleavage dioxygenase
VNGWEETRADGATELVLIVPVFREYPATVPIHTPREPHAELMEYRLDVDRGTVSGERRLIDGFYERPGINPAWLGRRSRFAWLLDEGAAGGEMGRGVLKLDLQSGERAGYFDYGDFVGGEPLFVAAAGATEEDHGYLLDLLMRDEAACLVVIDARDMTELARLPLPQRVPYGVHACWLDRAQLGALARAVN